MANKPGHRRFGNVRRRESGRWQVRYPGPDGRLRSAPETFARKSDAERYLTLVEAQMTRGEWVDPERAKITLGDYAERWIVQRPNLRPRTIALYRWLLGKHIMPYLGRIPLGKLSTSLVREWRSSLLDQGVSVSMAAKAYRLLRAVLTTAVKEDEILTKNPCRIPGADQEKTPERPILRLEQVFDLTDLTPERYRPMILLAAFASLRWGEVTALQRQDLELVVSNPEAGSSDALIVERATVTVNRAYTEVRGTGLVLGPPKSRAGRRTITIPASIVPTLLHHLEEHVDPIPDALVFTTESGKPIWRGNFNRLVDWKATVEKVGAPGLHFHDLRHTGNTLAARTGASLADLMARMGHDSSQAALIYQHKSREADQAIAAALDATMTKIRKNAFGPKMNRRSTPERRHTPTGR
jgi:integrase